MPSPSFAQQPAHNLSALKHAIMDDVRSIDDVDDFLTVDEIEDDVLVLLCKEKNIWG